MRFARPLVSFAAAVSVLAITSIASADALPPDAEDCLKKSTGDTCMTSTGASGTCSPQQQPASPSCTFFAMEAGTDAEACSQVVQVCEAGGDAGKQTGGTSDGGATSTSDGGTTPSSNGSTGTSKSGCSTTGMEASDVARAGAPFLLAAIVPLVLRRRKRNKDRA